MARGKFQASNGDNRRLHDLPASADALPDTVSVDLDDKDPNNIQVIEVDDRPVADRGKDTEWNGESIADQEAELRGLSARTQKRLTKLSAEVHTERRGREETQRERDAAIERIRAQDAELAQYRLATESTNTTLLNSMAGEREVRITDARRRLEAAFAEGNAAAQAAATSDLSQAQAELVAIRTRAANPPPAPPPVQQQQPQARQAPAIAPRALAWVQRNTWFDSTGADDKSRDALDINEALTRRGVDPNSEAYTQELDRRLKALYPDHIPFDGGASTPRRTNPVADGGREDENRRPANPRTVELTRSELSIAKRLGVSPQAYAVDKLKYEAKLRGAR